MGRFDDARGLQRPGGGHASTARRSACATSAEAEDGTKEQRSLARLNGVPTVTLEVRRQSGANTVAVIEGVKAALDARRRRSCPPDVKLEIIRDQSRYIYAALHEINLHLVLGSILACLVVLAVHAQLARRRSSPRSPSRPRSIATFGMM